MINSARSPILQRPTTKFGPIITDNKTENEQKEPYSLPDGYEWGDIDLSKNNELDKLF